MTIAAGDRMGPYEVLGPLGAGGMGSVYRARDSRLRRAVAIKVLTADADDPSLVRRFETEAFAASALNHPNIVTVYEFGVHEGRHYLVTELIDGETLRERLRRGPLRLRDALDIAVQIASALEAAHAEGLIHRDVKPENVMIRPDGYVKVVDFGLAKTTPVEEADPHTTITRSTLPGTVLGTIGYMPPEQVRGLPVDARADIWALGVVLHEMISGTSPFAAPTASDVIASVLERQPPPLGSLEASATGVDRIVRRCLAKDAGDRYQSVKDLAADLRLEVAKLTSAPPRRPESEIATVFQHRSSVATEIDVPPPDAPAARSGMAWIIVLLGVIVAAGVAGWALMFAGDDTPAATVSPPPVHRLEYALTTQRLEKGQTHVEVPVSDRDLFDRQSRFRFTFRSTRPGFIYVIGETPGAPESARLQLLFPTPTTPDGAAIAGNTDLRTGWYVFDAAKDSERLWLIWSAVDRPELHDARQFSNAKDLGVIRDAVLAMKIVKLLAAQASEGKTSFDSTTGRTVIEGTGAVLAARADLRLK